MNWRDKIDHAIKSNEYNKTRCDGWYDEHGSHYTHIANAVPQADVDSYMRGTRGLFEQYREGK